MSYIDDEEIKINIDEGDEEEGEELNEPLEDDDLLDDDDDLLDDEFKGFGTDETE